MPEPTIQDVLDSIGNLDIKIEHIKKKVNAIKDQTQFLRVCTTCMGTGKLIYFEDSQPGVPLEKVCPLCAGNKNIPFGEIKKVEEE